MMQTEDALSRPALDSKARRVPRWLAALGVALATLLVVGSAQAYETIDVVDGGSIEGVVTYKGSEKGGGKLEVTKDNATCGDSVDDVSLLVGGSGELQNAVVYIKAIQKGLAPKTDGASLDQHKCGFTPHVQVVGTGTKLEILNSDPILHNVHGYQGGDKTVFNLAMPLKGQKIKRALKDAGLISMKCDAGHVWMSSYIHVLDHPYGAVTDASGKFKIEGVPAGEYELVVWHERVKGTTLKVKVEAGKAATADAALQ